MTWVNLNDVYVKNTGGTINGDLDVNGAITVNDGSGNGTKYNVANEISTLRDSVSYRAWFQTYSLNDAKIYAIPSDKQQVILNVTHKNGDTYELVAFDDGIALWKGNGGGYIWRINA